MTPSTPPNQIYQYSLLNALMSGLCNEGITARKLLQHGTQGLGTFANMDGELVMLDSTIYHFHADGSVVRAAADERIPFAMVTNFEAERVLHNQTIKEKSSVQGILDEVVPKTGNSFVAYRIHGVWKEMHVRMIRGREYPGQPLSEIGAKQAEYIYENISGTVIGFRSPVAWQGFSVAGHHLHFLSDDEKLGGHILQLRSGDEGVKVEVAVVADVHIELPRGEEFNEAEMVVDDEGIKRVEG
ncbi:Alpha-acetolactate decarboxylase [Ascosphaera apis ARSEF 7405]|uniref:Alpha-acetolactate decarboxylase n=1 Tax=Ascosphaera apis ARSEF 7405 TaxID=392613 RepID=A0A166NQ32_9EURO|nr:Alpha-acetolactate decarboxylase [Ascosphaera apis ARSEF 7405]